MYKIKDLKGEKLVGSFYKKKLLLSTLCTTCYPEPGCYINNKVKLALDWLNYATQKN